MTLKNTISTELLTLAPFLSTIERGNPFTVPNAYFNQFAQNTLDEILEIEELGKEAATTLALRTGKSMTIPQNYFEELWHNVMLKTDEDNASTENLTPKATEEIFTTPLGYFETLQANVFAAIADANEDIDCQTELEAIENVEEKGLSLPSNYFEQFQATVMQRIHNLSDEEEGVDTDMIDQVAVLDPFALPEDYFEVASEATLLAVSDLEYVSEVLSETASDQHFTTPKGYFEQLQNSILQAVKAEEIVAKPEMGRTVAMPNQKQSVPFVKYALRIAAVLTILFVGWQILDRQDTGNNQTAMLGPNAQVLMKMDLMMQESGLTGEDLQAYITYNAEEFANMDLEDMDINASDLAMKNQSGKDILLNQEAIDLLDITTDELEDFLNE